MNITGCRITINPEINQTDRELLAHSLAKLDTESSPAIDGGTVYMTVESDD